jgi:hypothetical protein
MPALFQPFLNEQTSAVYNTQRQRLPTHVIISPLLTCLGSFDFDCLLFAAL